MISKYKIHLIFAIPLIFLFSLLILIPYYSLFGYEKDDFSLKTKFELEEIEKINEVLSRIDETKITDDKMKKNLSSLKENFYKEKENILAENLRKEEQKKIEDLAKKLEKERIEKENQEKERLKKLEEERNKPKEIIYPKDFDITKKLAKLHIQERKLSCEAAATTDILSTILKKNIDEKDILDKMKKDKTYGKPSYVKDGKIIWGDPNQGFVGEMDGHQYNLTGYAIYEKPMSEIYVDYGVKFDTYNKFENNLGLKNTKQALTYMLKELVKGNYVQMWGDYCTDQQFEDGNIDRKISTDEANSGLSQKNFCYSFNQERMITWYTEEGKEIRAGKQSHNFVLLGYIGDIENPEKIIIWDTQTGRHIYPTHERLRKWELNDARAIIVYNNEKDNIDQKTEKNEKKNDKNELNIKSEEKRKEDSENEKN